MAHAGCAATSRHLRRALENMTPCERAHAHAHHAHMHTVMVVITADLLHHAGRPIPWGWACLEARPRFVQVEAPLLADALDNVLAQ